MLIWERETPEVHSETAWQQKSTECEPGLYSCRSGPQSFSTWYIAIQGKDNTLLNLNPDWSLKWENKHLKVTSFYMM